MGGVCGCYAFISSLCSQYQLYGEPVVKACIGQKCNYVDITGETYVSIVRVNHVVSGVGSIIKHGSKVTLTTIINPWHMWSNLRVTVIGVCVCVCVRSLHITKSVYTIKWTYQLS